MMHDYHDALPGYDPRQIWHDGCKECEHRGKTVPYSVGTLDDERLRRAWTRMLAWDGGHWEGIGTMSKAELPLLRFLEQVRLVNRHLNYAGIAVFS